LECGMFASVFENLEMENIKSVWKMKVEFSDGNWIGNFELEVELGMEGVELKELVKSVYYDQ